MYFFFLSEKPNEDAIPWLLYGIIGDLSGICLILFVIMLIVFKKKRLFIFKPRTSPVPMRHCQACGMLHESSSSIELFPEVLLIRFRVALHGARDKDKGLSKKHAACSAAGGPTWHEAFEKKPRSKRAPRRYGFEEL